MSLTVKDAITLVVALVGIMIGLDSVIEYNLEPDKPDEPDKPAVTFKIDPEVEAAMSDAQRAEWRRTCDRLEKNLAAAHEAAKIEDGKRKDYSFLKGVFSLAVLAFCVFGRVITGIVFANDYSPE